MRLGNRRIEWRLKQVMQERNIKSVAKLHQLLQQVSKGLVGKSQLYKIVHRLPGRVNTKVLLALTEVLDCEVHDLLTCHRENTPEIPGE
ncbi:MAG: helix-turn-helix transcriptional regulator [Chlorobiales bacterium]|nr:helix-turn-helix transcriptional regulator [Chlorobiales bacterium]